MTCVTPSNPDAIPFGESQDISDTLARTSRGSLFRDGRDMSRGESSLATLAVPELDDATIVGDRYRVDQTEFLVAQTASKPSEIMKLWKQSIENARRAPLYRSTTTTTTRSRAAGAASNLGAVVDQPLRKIRSIRFEQQRDDDLHPRGSPTPLVRRRCRRSSSSSVTPAHDDHDDPSPRLGRDDRDPNVVEFDEFDEIPVELDQDDHFSVHRPLTRMHV